MLWPLSVAIETELAEEVNYFNFNVSAGSPLNFLSINCRLAILKNYEAIRGKVVADIGAGTGELGSIQSGSEDDVDKIIIWLHLKRVNNFQMSRMSSI